MFNTNIIGKFEKIKEELIADAIVIEKETEDALAIFRDTLTQLENIEIKLDVKLTLLDNNIKTLEILKDEFNKNKTDNQKLKMKLIEFLK